MALPNNNILPGAAPLLWSNMKSAFDLINENFTALDLATGGASVNLETLNTTVAPADDNTYALGKLGTNRWKSVFLAEYHDTPADAANGVYIGSAQIRGRGSLIELPANSTVVGVPIKEPFFNSVQVDNGNRVEANTTSAPWGETLNLLSGTGIQMTVSSGADSITVDNTGILSITPSSGISATTVSGVTTITNTGVRSLTSTTSLPSGRTVGAGINIDNSTGDGIKITNAGVLSIEAGSAALTISTDSATGIVTITNAAPAQPAFQQIEVNGDSANRLVADGTAGIFRILSGQGITLSKTVGTDTMTITVNPVFDLRGSVFGDDSTKIVDAVENKVYAEFFGNLTGAVTGNVLGNVTGNADTATVASTVTLTATNTTAAAHFVTFVDTATGNEGVRTDTSLTYNPNSNILTAGTFSGNLTGTVTGNIFTSLIDSADSSAITVTPATIFSSDVTVENDLNVTQRFLLRGSRVINLTELKSVVAASASFADFQTRIAALV